MKKFPEYDMEQDKHSVYLMTDASEAPMGLVMSDVKEKFNKNSNLQGISVYYTAEECIFYVRHSDVGTHAFWKRPRSKKRRL